MIKLTTMKDQAIFIAADKVVAVCLDSTGNTQVHMEDGTDSFWAVTEPVDEVVRKIENWNESTYDQCVADATLGRALREKWPGVMIDNLDAMAELERVCGSVVAMAERFQHYEDGYPAFKHEYDSRSKSDMGPWLTVGHCKMIQTALIAMQRSP